MDSKILQLLNEASFTLSVLKQQENIENIWLKEQIKVIEDLVKQINRLEEDSSVIYSNTKISKKTRDEIHEEAKKLFKEINFRIKLDKNRNLKEYFPKNLSETVIDKKTFLRSFENIQLKLNNETSETLLSFKDRVSDMVKSLKNIDDSLINLDSNRELKNIDKNLLYEKFEIEYKRLKYILKAIYLGTKVNDSMFYMKKTVRKQKKDLNITE